MSNQAGKGDTPRPVDPKKYGENYDRIFRKEKSAKDLARETWDKICADTHTKSENFKSRGKPMFE